MSNFIKKNYVIIACAINQMMFSQSTFLHTQRGIPIFATVAVAKKSLIFLYVSTVSTFWPL